MWKKFCRWLHHSHTVIDTFWNLYLIMIEMPCTQAFALLNIITKPCFLWHCQKSDPYQVHEHNYWKMHHNMMENSGYKSFRWYATGNLKNWVETLWWVGAIAVTWSTSIMCYYPLWFRSCKISENGIFFILINSSSFHMDPAVNAFQNKSSIDLFLQLCFGQIAPEFINQVVRISREGLCGLNWYFVWIWKDVNL